MATDSTASEVWVTLDDATYSKGAWQAYQPSPGSDVGDFVFPLLEDDGQYTVYVRFRDQAGNIAYHPDTDGLRLSIDLDTTPPTLPVTAATEYFVREDAVTRGVGKLGPLPVAQELGS